MMMPLLLSNVSRSERETDKIAPGWLASHNEQAASGSDDLPLQPPAPQQQPYPQAIQQQQQQPPPPPLPPQQQQKAMPMPQQQVMQQMPLQFRPQYIPPAAQHVQLPRSCRDLLLEPETIPSTSLQKEKEMFATWQNLISQSLAKESLPFSDGNSSVTSSASTFNLAKEIRVAVAFYQKKIRELQREDEEYADMTKSVYANVPSKSNALLTSGTGQRVNAEFPVTLVQLSDGSIM